MQTKLPFDETIYLRGLGGRDPLAGRLGEEAVVDHAEHPLAEVPRIERAAGDRFVDGAELGDAERLGDELAGEAIDLRAEARDGRVEDRGVVEGEIEILHLIERMPLGVRDVAAPAHER